MERWIITHFSFDAAVFLISLLRSFRSFVINSLLWMSIILLFVGPYIVAKYLLNLGFWISFVITIAWAVLLIVIGGGAIENESEVREEYERKAKEDEPTRS